MSFVAKVITKKVLKERVANSFGQEDPYFETVPATRLDGAPNGKVKKRKKALPPGISEHDGRVLTKVKRRAWRLDMCLFSICGIRFGWGSAIAIVPAIGDVIDALLSLMVFRTCCQVEGGLPSSIKLKMMFNIIFDFAIGLVPFVGDIADAAFRCNTKNAVLLEQNLRKTGKTNLRKRGLPVPDDDPSDPDAYDRRRQDHESDTEVVDRQPQRSDTMPAKQGTNRTRNHANGSSRPINSRNASAQGPSRVNTAPSRAKTTDSRRSPGWFGWGRRRPEDVEIGEPEMEERRPPSHQSKRNRREH